LRLNLAYRTATSKRSRIKQVPHRQLPCLLLQLPEQIHVHNRQFEIIISDSRDGDPLPSLSAYAHVSTQTVCAAMFAVLLFGALVNSAFAKPYYDSYNRRTPSFSPADPVSLFKRISSGCSTSGPASCSSSSVSNTCCTEFPGGLLLQPQVCSSLILKMLSHIFFCCIVLGHQRPLRYYYEQYTQFNSFQPSTGPSNSWTIHGKAFSTFPFICTYSPLLRTMAR
jgi:hypothetical protein